ncbi:MAG: hypothetical protein AAF989_16570, partial [Planctomycetota bacterium]
MLQADASMERFLHRQIRGDAKKKPPKTPKRQGPKDTGGRFRRKPENDGHGRLFMHSLRTEAAKTPSEQGKQTVDWPDTDGGHFGNFD